MLNIVLVHPEIPQNTGNIARTCSVTGASLHLVKPMGFEIDNAKLKRAGLDYWDTLDIHYYESLEEFLSLHEKSRLFFFTTKADKRYTDVSYKDGDFLVFGCETKGLPESLLCKNSEKCLRIPMRKNLRSLNLSNSAAIAVYEALRQSDFEGLETDGERLGRLLEGTAENPFYNG